MGKNSKKKFMMDRYPREFDKFKVKQDLIDEEDLSSSQFYYKFEDEKNFVKNQKSYWEFRELKKKYPEMNLCAKISRKSRTPSLDRGNNSNFDKSFSHDASKIDIKPDPNVVNEKIIHQVSQIVAKDNICKEVKEKTRALDTFRLQKQETLIKKIKNISDTFIKRQKQPKSQYSCSICKENMPNFFFICLNCTELKMCNGCQEKGKHQKRPSNNQTSHPCRIMRVTDKTQNEEIEKIRMVYKIKQRLGTKKRQNQIKMNAVKYACNNMLSNKFCEDFIQQNQNESPADLVNLLKHKIN